MSLISFRNFTAPLGSKVQIGALLILAFLAFVVRYGSGGQAEAPRSVSQARRVVTQEEMDLLAVLDNDTQAVAPRRKPISEPDPFLEDAVAGGGAPARPAAAQPAPSDRRQGGGALDDVRRSMGLE